MLIKAVATRLVWLIGDLNMPLRLIMLMCLAGVLLLPDATHVALLTVMSPAVATALADVMLLVSCSVLIRAIRIATTQALCDRHAAHCRDHWRTACNTTDRVPV